MPSSRRRARAVFHLAAQIDVRHSVSGPPTTPRPTCWARSTCSRRRGATGARAVVNTSTGGGLYGDADVLPTPEDSPIRPLAPYGQSKLGAEGYCALYTRLHGLSTVSLRYGNVYGPRQDVHGEAGVVAIFCGHLVDGTAPTVFGDGGQTRDWVDVGRRRAGQPAGGRRPASPDRSTSATGRRPRCSSSSKLSTTSRPSKPLPAPELLARSDPGRCAAAAWTSAGPATELGWEASVSLREGLRTILAGLF